MNNHSSMSKTSRKTTDDPSPHSFSGESAVAIAPPEYGIDFIDNGITTTAPVQCMGFVTQGVELMNPTTQPRGVVQLMSEELESEANRTIKAIKSGAGVIVIPEVIDLHKRLNNEYTSNDDFDAGMKGFDLKKSIEGKIVDFVKPVVKELLISIKKRLTDKLESDTPKWVEDLPNLNVDKGEGIPGGVAVGSENIFIVPSTGADLLLDGTLQFSLAHEVGHIVSGKLAQEHWGSILKTDEEIAASGVTIKSTIDNQAKKFEEIRADIFGAEMLAGFMGIEPSSLNKKAIEGGINAPADAEHPSFDERKEMLTNFLGINFKDVALDDTEKVDDDAGLPEGVMPYIS